jgi:hypothetical protein
MLMLVSANEGVDVATTEKPRSRAANAAFLFTVTFLPNA